MWLCKACVWWSVEESTVEYKQEVYGQSKQVCVLVGVGWVGIKENGVGDSRSGLAAR